MLREDRSVHGHGVDIALQNAIQQTFKQLGGVSSNALLWYLNTRGYTATGVTIDLDSFYRGVQSILGQGADMVMQMLFETLCDTFGYATDGKAINSDMYMVDRINAVLQRAAEEGQIGEKK